jgi:hypothetical protein
MFDQNVVKSRLFPLCMLIKSPKKGICEIQDQSFLQSIANFEAFRHFVLKEASKTCFLEVALYLQEKNCYASNCLVGDLIPKVVNPLPLWVQISVAKGAEFFLPL